MGGKRLEWSVLKWNEPSIKFYEAMGAVMMSEWVGMRVDGGELERMAGKDEGLGGGEEVKKGEGGESG